MCRLGFLIYTYLGVYLTLYTARPHCYSSVASHIQYFGFNPRRAYKYFSKNNFLPFDGCSVFSQKYRHVAAVNISFIFVAHHV